jgi:hypothetical protein
MAGKVASPAHGHFPLPSDTGHGVELREETLAQRDIVRQISTGEGAAVGRRAMGDYWEREQIR